MCGIVGVVGDLRDYDLEVFKKLLFIDTLRGDDSTGLAAVNLSGRVNVAKSALPGHEFIKTKLFEATATTSQVALIGHNRAATLGTVSDANAHPFTHKHITGVHNGTLNLGYEHHLFENIEKKQFDVDSEHFYYALSELGDEEALKRTHGSFAFVWYDSETGQINFIRNDKRPLYYLRSKDRKLLYFVSEPSMLITAINETRGPGFEADGLFTLFEANMLHSMDLPSTFQQKLPAFHKKSIKVSSVFKTYVTPPNNPRHGWGPNVVEYDYKKAKYNSPKPAATPPPNPNNFSSLPPDKRAEISREYWDVYSHRKKSKAENKGFQNFIANRAVGLSLKQVVEHFKQYKDKSDDLFDMFATSVVIPGYPEYEPGDTRKMMELMSSIDYLQTLLQVWKDLTPSRAQRVIFARIKNELKMDPSSVFGESTQIIHVLPDKDQTDLSDQPSGLGNLTNKQFLDLAKNNGCGHCGSKQIEKVSDWEPQDCILTTGREVICPECTITENIQTMLAEGVIHRA